MIKSLITGTFTVTPVLAMAVASTIIWAVGVGSKKAIIALALTGIGGLIVASLLSVGLAVLANRFGWSEKRLAAW